MTKRGQIAPVVWGVGGLVLGSLFGALVYAKTHVHAALENPALRQSALNANSAYKYINPLLGLQLPLETPPELKPLEDRIETFIDTQVKKGNATVVSVYFRQIGKQQGITINPKEKYNPASLLKVPTMMAYFKISEKDPSILEDKLTYTGATDENEQEHIRSSVELVPNRAYTVSELIEHMIKYSDNNAAVMLIEHLNATNHEDAFNNLFLDLGITEVDLNDDFITAPAYALFFRVLYNATYLTRDDSEKAMELLTKTDFTDGIVAGISSSVRIPVAHKFGEFTQLNTKEELIKHELHDCGYIYYPPQTYSLCVMTKGDDFDELKGVLSGISKLVYQEVSAR